MNISEQIEPYLDHNEAAAFLHLGAKTIQAWARAGKIPARSIPIGSKKKWLFRKSELDGWVKGQKA